MLLFSLLCFEILARIVVEIREYRLMQMRLSVFSFLRLIPLVNDIVPLPENRKAVPNNAFVKRHEEGHKIMRHSILRNIFKVIMLMLAVWFLSALLVREGASLWQGILWLHLAAIPFRVIFHLYCWNQEYEADKYAHKELGKTKTKNAMRDLAENEIPYTKLFAVLYREHPTASLRSQKLLRKLVK